MYYGEAPLCSHPQLQICRILNGHLWRDIRSHLDEDELDMRWQIADMLSFSILPMAGIT